MYLPYKILYINTSVFYNCLREIIYSPCRLLYSAYILLSPILSLFSQLQSNGKQYESLIKQCDNNLCACL